MSYLKPQVSFSLNFGSLFNVMKDNSSVLFCRIFMWFLQKEPTKVQNFIIILTTQVKFHQICILIGSFCWKYIKLKLIKYRGVMSHDTEDLWKIWRKTNLLFQKWQEFGEFWSEHSKSPKFALSLVPFVQSI